MTSLLVGCCYKGQGEIISKTVFEQKLHFSFLRRQKIKLAVCMNKLKKNALSYLLSNYIIILARTSKVSVRQTTCVYK